MQGAKRGTKTKKKSGEIKKKLPKTTGGKL